jgi:hypothetical protein
MSVSDVPNLPAGERLPAVPRRRRWVSLLLGLVLFGSGFIVGAGLTFIVIRKAVIESVRHPVTDPARLAERLRRPLGLTPEQTRGVEGVFRQRQVALDKLRREVQPRVLTELEELESQVAELLTPPQREKWQKMFADLKSTWLPPPEENAPAKTTQATN